ncbi:MAG: hypothetical protein HY553_16030 [Elusimicrobia bacterium]|nr:hypothetical protein [Elusimicrobiota bacterium]
MLSRLVLALVLTAAASASYAGPPQTKPKTRTLAELIELAMREGYDDTMGPIAIALGMESDEVPSMRLRYKQSATPDKREHALSVLYRKDDARRVPVSLILSTGTGRKENGRLFADVTYYHASLSGKLKGAGRAVGFVGEMTTSAIKVDRSIKNGLQAELEFHRNTVPRLGLEYAK